MRLALFLSRCRFFCLLCCATIQLAGCSSGSDDLDREKALELLMASDEIPKEALSGLTLRDSFMTGSLANIAVHLDTLVESGLATYTVAPLPRSNSRSEYVVRLTERGLKLARSDASNPSLRQRVKVVTYILESVEITGIAYLDESKSIARVEYTISYNPTEFASDPDVFAKKGFQKGGGWAEVLNRTSTFVLFDDGWRIK